MTIQAKTKQKSWFSTLLIGLLPWLLIIGIFLYMRKRVGGMGGAGGGLFGFGKSKAKLYTKSSSNVTFEDVAGLANAKKELSEIVDFLKDPSKFRTLGGKLPRGVLLAGPPGTGKTLMARAAAGEADVPFYSISGSEFIEMFVGVGASRVRDMFERAKKDAPAIIFIDEIDSIGRVRGTGLGGGHDEREQTLNQILSEMDGFEAHQSVVVLAATNRPDILDPALVRPGRFDRQVTLDLPQREARKEILQIHARQVRMADHVDLGVMADMTVGFSGAQLENLINEAALLAARKNKTHVELEDLEQSRDKILLGLEREERISDEEKKAIAYHEAGHTLLAKLLPNVDPLQKVTIIPRGRAMGATEQIPQADRHNFSRSYLLNRIAIMLGGRVAEKIVYDDITTGAGDDLKNATQVARRMVCQWGMSERLGAMTFKQGEEHPFLGRELTEPKDFSEHTAQVIDEEVQRIVHDMEKKAREVLEPNRDKLDAIAKALFESHRPQSFAHSPLADHATCHLGGVLQVIA
ncbi:MAG: ATP-dependent zinc metalloprotease FtsH, partial [Deltaproteobacteria bacterium]